MLFRTLHQLDIDKEETFQIRISPALYKLSVGYGEAPEGDTNISHRGVPIVVDSDLERYSIQLDQRITTIDTEITVSG